MLDTLLSILLASLWTGLLVLSAAVVSVFP